MRKFLPGNMSMPREKNCNDTQLICTSSKGKLKMARPIVLIGVEMKCGNGIDLPSK